jgi:hypothetical protein
MPHALSLFMIIRNLKKYLHIIILVLASIIILMAIAVLKQGLVEVGNIFCTFKLIVKKPVFCSRKLEASISQSSYPNCHIPKGCLTKTYDHAPTKKVQHHNDSHLATWKHQEYFVQTETIHLEHTQTPFYFTCESHSYYNENHLYT